MGAQKVATKFLRAWLPNLSYRQAGGIGTYDGLFVSRLVDAGHHLLLDIHFFHDGFAHPVGLPNGLFQVIFKISRADAVGVFG